MRVLFSVLITGLVLFGTPVQAQSNGGETTVNEMKRKSDECRAKRYIIEDLEVPAYKTCIHSCSASDTYYLRSMNGTPPSKEEVKRTVEACNTSHKEVMEIVAKTQGVSPSVHLGLTALDYQDKMDRHHKRCLDTQSVEACDCATKNLSAKLNVAYRSIERSYPRALASCKTGKQLRY